MIDVLSITNVLAWSLQVLVVAGVGMALPAVLRLDAPGVRYTYWRALLALCFVLPFVQPRRTMPAMFTAGPSHGVDVTVSSPAAAVSATPAVDWISIGLLVLVVGVAVRVAWIAFGLMHLRRLRGAGAAAQIDGYEELQRLIGARAELRYVPGLKQPVTFGIRPAVVLLPDIVRDQPAEVQRAILSHELFHVQRHDWAWLLVEELVRAVFWFHPAMWWLVSRIQLTREEVVDEMALLVARRRSTYVQALLAFADTPPFTPVAAFARRRHLFRRIALISKEAAMSSKRLIASCAAMATVVAMGGWYAVSAFPLRQSVPHVAAQPAQRGGGTLEAQAKPVTPENPVPRRVSYVAPIYPDEAAAEELSGSVTVRLTIAADGTVAEARAIGFAFRAPHAPTAGKVVAPARGDALSVNGPHKALVDAAVDAVRQWRYDPPFEAPLSFNVTINFRPDKAGGVDSALGAPPPPPPPPPPAGVSGGVTGGVAGGVPGGVVGGVSHTQAPPPPPPPPPGFDKPALRAGGAIGSPKKIRDVKPIYPEEAKAAGIQGVVILEIRIDEEGNVSDARVMRSIAELDEAALEAVLQWGFMPTLMDGKPVPVVATVTVNFTLK